MVQKPDGKIHWVKKDAFVMPVLPKTLKIDPLVAGFLHMLAFLELSGDEAVDPDWAVEAMEHVGYYFDQLSPKAKSDFAAQVERVAAHARKKKWSSAAVEFFDNFMESFGIVDEDD
jgi:hypothetical protein